LLKAERFEEAIKEFKSAVEIDPNYKEAIYNLGASYVQLGGQIKTTIRGPCIKAKS
jgi:tetratricopeptide (TPR) repeat protein